ncbi:dehydrogenase/reductase SDR family member 1-like [Asterias amurensis]|uniref:dehydrogenase/reductase SDR family member 1-like n=1 Tax=Asterias amurensis TaxID=7602 RepID=UPI003AB66574
MAAPLSGKVCLVTGATRGIGKGIALQLGEAGATVYITGRTLKAKTDATAGTPSGSLTSTAEEIEARGGKCIPVQCDHSDDEQVKKLFEQISTEQNGRLDVLVNNAFSAVTLIAETQGKKFWEMPPTVWDTINNVGLRGHYIASWHAAQMMVPAKQGLIINVSSIGGLKYYFNVAYGVGKAACDRMAADCAFELKKHNVAFVSLWPGAVKTEIFEEARTSDSASKFRDKFLRFVFQYGETIELPGKAVVHLAQDKKIMNKSGRIVLTAELASEYGFTDIDGSTPTNFRQIKSLLNMSGHTWLASVTPSFLKIPFWMLCLTSSKF